MPPRKHSAPSADPSPQPVATAAPLGRAERGSEVQAPQPMDSVRVNDLAAAIAQATATAIETARPQKKTIFNRTPHTPWTPEDGSKKLKLKRKTFQHSIEVRPDFHSNEEIALLNQIRPGVYCEGHVRVTRRRDKGIDITWPHKVVAQRMRLVQQFGLRNLREILARCIDEASNPSKYKKVGTSEYDDD